MHLLVTISLTYIYQTRRFCTLSFAMASEIIKNTFFEWETLVGAWQSDVTPKCGILSSRKQNPQMLTKLMIKGTICCFEASKMLGNSDMLFYFGTWSCSHRQTDCYGQSKVHKIPDNCSHHQSPDNVELQTQGVEWDDWLLKLGPQLLPDHILNHSLFSRQFSSFQPH